MSYCQIDSELSDGVQELRLQSIIFVNQVKDREELFSRGSGADAHKRANRPFAHHLISVDVRTMLNLKNGVEQESLQGESVYLHRVLVRGGGRCTHAANI